jgi:hypothetical protein
MSEKSESLKNIGAIPKDFTFSELKVSRQRGGSSRIWLLGDDFVVKEPLHPVHDREQLMERFRKVRNSIALCKKYLSDAFLDEECIVKKNVHGQETVFLIQKKAPAKSVDLNPDEWNFTFDDHARHALKTLIQRIEKMYADTGCMIDILTLSNIFYDTDKRIFFMIDADPLICDREREEELSSTFMVTGNIDTPGFTTYNGNVTSNAMEANKEHLGLLRYLAEYEG